MLNDSDFVVLDCAVDDGSKVSWYKDDSAITENFNKYTFTTRGLMIKPVVKSDAAKYYCKAGALTSGVASLTVECKYIVIGIALSDTGVWRYQTQWPRIP